MVEWKWIAPKEINPEKNPGRKKWKVSDIPQTSVCCDILSNSTLCKAICFFFNSPPPPWKVMNIFVKLTEGARLQI